MSVSFYIAPYNPSNGEESSSKEKEKASHLKIEPKDYETAILKRWPQARIATPLQGHDPSALFHWILPVPREGFSGLRVSLLPDLQIVAFGTGPKETFLEFILWHRSFISTNYQLFLFDSSSYSTDSLELTIYTTAQDIVDFTGIID